MSGKVRQVGNDFVGIQEEEVSNYNLGCYWDSYGFVIL